MQGPDLLPLHGVRVVALEESAPLASFRHHISRLGGDRVGLFAFDATGVRTRALTYTIEQVLEGLADEVKENRTAVVEVLGPLEDRYRNVLFFGVAAVAAQAGVPLTWIGA